MLTNNIAIVLWK